MATKKKLPPSRPKKRSSRGPTRKERLIQLTDKVLHPLAGLLAKRQLERLGKDVALAIEDPAGYVTKHRGTLNERGITKPCPDLHAIALVDGLRAAGALGEVDWRAEPGEVRKALVPLARLHDVPLARIWPDGDDLAVDALLGVVSSELANFGKRILIVDLRNDDRDFLIIDAPIATTFAAALRRFGVQVRATTKAMGVSRSRSSAHDQRPAAPHLKKAWHRLANIKPDRLRGFEKAEQKTYLQKVAAETEHAVRALSVLGRTRRKFALHQLCANGTGSWEAIEASVAYMGLDMAFNRYHRHGDFSCTLLHAIALGWRSIADVAGGALTETMKEMPKSFANSHTCHLALWLWNRWTKADVGSMAMDRHSPYARLPKLWQEPTRLEGLVPELCDYHLNVDAERSYSEFEGDYEVLPVEVWAINAVLAASKQPTVPLEGHPLLETALARFPAPSYDPKTDTTLKPLLKRLSADKAAVLDF